APSPAPVRVTKCPSAPSGSRRNWLRIRVSGWGALRATLPGAVPALVPLAVPDEGGRVGVPPGDGVLQPRDQLALRPGVLAGECAADDDPLDRLGQVQPGAAERRVQRHDALPEQPAHDGPAQVAGEVVPDQEQSEGWQRLARLVAEPG